MFKLLFSVPRALARKSRLARTLSFTQVSEIAQVSGESVGLPCVIPPSRSNLDVGQIWEGGVF